MTSSYAKEMNREEFAAVMKRNPVVVLPIGSVEEHGVHLPLGSDTFEIDFVIDRLAKKLDLLVLPTINYGNCGSTYNFPGTISISFDTLRALIADILSEVVRQGGRRILVISGHAGSNHMVAMRQAAQMAVKEHPKLRIMVMSDYDLVPEYKGGNVPSWDGHAGMAETSRMLNIRPDISKRGKVATRAKYQEYVVLPDPESQFPTGVSGDPRRASAELGRKIDDYVLKRLITLIKKNLGSGD
jgi:creatinine amidohydrolase